MSIIRYFFCCILLLFSFYSLHAQGYCEAFPTAEEIEFMDENSPFTPGIGHYSIPSEQELITFPIVFHIYNQNENDLLSPAQINDQLSILNNRFEPMNIQFSELYEKFYYSYDIAGHRDTLYKINEYPYADYEYIPNVINIYIVDYIESTNGEIGGFANFPQGLAGSDGTDRIFLSDGNLFDPTSGVLLPLTLPHEMGHFFGLYHTFQGILAEDCTESSGCFTCTEYPPSNTYLNGDRCEDTPLMPPGNILDENCELTCSSLPPPFENLSASEGNNIMSYNTHSCCTDFTDDQLNRGNFYAVNYRSYLSDNTQSSLLELLSPQFQNVLSYQSIYFSYFHGGSTNEYVDFFYKFLDQEDWIYFKTDLAIPGLNIFKDVAPFYFGDGQIGVEIRIQYNSTPEVFDIGEPFVVFESSTVPFYEENLNLSISETNLYNDGYYFISWDEMAIPENATGNIFISSYGGPGGVEIVSVTNTGSYIWHPASLQESEITALTIQFSDDPGNYFIDFIPHYISTHNCKKPDISYNTAIDCEKLIYHDLEITFSADEGALYNLLTIPPYNSYLEIDHWGEYLIENVESSSSTKIIVQKTENFACADTLEIFDIECGLGNNFKMLLLAIDYLNNIQRKLVGIIQTAEDCSFLPANPLESLGREIFTFRNDNELPSALITPVEDLYTLYLVEEARMALNLEYYGLLYFNDNFTELENIFSPYIDSTAQITSMDSINLLSELSVFDIEEYKIQGLIRKWNRSLLAWDQNVFSPDSTFTDIVDAEVISNYKNRLQDGETYLFNRGFSNYENLYNFAIQSIQAYSLEDDPETNAVCASVSIELSQKLTMTREAFLGTLTIYNGSEDTEMDSIELELEILDDQGTWSNDLFEIETQELITLTAIDGTGQLAADKEGIAKILFIPEKGAAPVIPKYYSFGGNLSYIDPFSGLRVTMPLIPVTLQVNPSPDLFLHYFLERDILGDDVFTPQIEPSVPATLGIMIENHGHGDANNVVIETAQPAVIDNEKGLALSLYFSGSKLEGEEANLGLDFINFGDIDSMDTKVGEWYFTSNLLGHFTGFETQLKHLDSRGNPNLSLISGTEAHELIKQVSIYSNDDGILDFLVNDVSDAEDNPDALYISQGKIVLEVHETEDAYFIGSPYDEGNTNTLVVDPANPHVWSYLKLDDPGDGNFEIVSVTRNFDGQEIPLDNAWLTWVTIPDSEVPVYEDKFHFADYFAGEDTVSYTLVWSPEDPTPPFIVSIDGAAEAVTEEQVTNLTVTFSEELMDSTFTLDDLTLNLQGGDNLIDSTVIITPIDSVTYDINIATLTQDANGLFIFIAQAAGVRDKTGTYGLTGEQVSWTQGIPDIEAYIGLPENNFASSFDTVQLLFNLPIDTSTISEASFDVVNSSPLRNGGGTLILSLVDESLKKFKLEGLGSYMTDDGLYHLETNLPTIKSTTNAYGLQVRSIPLYLDTQIPELTSWSFVDVGSLDGQHHTGLILEFNEEIVEFDSTVFSLEKDLSSFDISPIIIEKLTENTVKIKWNTLATYPEASYAFELDMSLIFDLTGNNGSGFENIMWTVDRTPELEISNLGISPDLGYSNTDGITSTTSLDLSFDINETANNIRIYQNDNGTLRLLSTISTANPGNISKSLVLLSGGNTALVVFANDIYGNEVSVSLNLNIDEAALTGSWLWNNGSAQSTHPDSIYFEFGVPVADEGNVPDSIFGLLINNNSFELPQLRFIRKSETSYLLTGLEYLDDQYSTFKVFVNTSHFHKNLSGRSGSDVVTTSWYIPDPNRSPFADAGPDLVIKDLGSVTLDASASSDPDGDALYYKWLPLDNVELNDSNAIYPSFELGEEHVGQLLSFLLTVSDGKKTSSDIARVFVELDDIIVYSKLFLQGPYEEALGLMKDNLREDEILTISTPYTDTTLYKFGKDGKSIDSSLYNISGNNAVVDWIYVELIDIQSDTAVRGGSFLLQRDGDIVDTNGISSALFENLLPGTYSLRFHHRNHVAIQTNETVSIFANTITNLDLTQDFSQLIGGINAVREVTGIYTMIAGDVDRNGEVQNTDIIQIMPLLGQSGYMNEDVDLNGEVQNIDIQNHTLPNLGRGKQFLNE